MVVVFLSEGDTWCLFLRYYSIVLELASHIFLLQVSLVRLSVQWFYFSSYFSRWCVSRSTQISLGSPSLDGLEIALIQHLFSRPVTHLGILYECYAVRQLLGL